AGRVVLVFAQVATFAAFAATARPLANGDSEFEWPMIGHDPANTRNQPFEHRIRPGNAHRLALKCVATTTGDVSAAPAVGGGAVTTMTGVAASGARRLIASFRGALVALNARTGEILWQSYSRPDNGGVPVQYAGATMFSPPPVDFRTGLVYGTFGQPCVVPAA